MSLESATPKGRHWERVSLPIIAGLVPGAYSNPQITVDELGRVTQITASGSSIGFGARNAGEAINGSPFSIIDLVGGNITAANGTGGVLEISVSDAAAVNVLNEDVLVGGGPFSSINFIGSAVNAADAGSGVIDINLDNATDNLMQFVKGIAGTGASQTIGSPITAGGLVRTVTVTVTAAYSPSSTLQVEDGDGVVLMGSGLINPQLTGTYVLQDAGNIAGITDPQITLVVGGLPAAGTSVVEVIYQVE